MRNQWIACCLATLMVAQPALAQESRGSSTTGCRDADALGTSRVLALPREAAAHGRQQHAPLLLRTLKAQGLRAADLEWPAQ